jgi:hypothetical protein
MNPPKVEANCCRNSARASELAGHADIRSTEVDFVRRKEDAEVAARRIQIRLTGRTGK